MEKTVQWSFLVCALYHALLKWWSNKKTCDGYWRHEKCIKSLVRESEEPENLKDWGIDGITILKWIIKKVAFGSVDWIQLTQEWVNWRVVLKGARNLRLSKNAS